tara:strand:- start:4374 stop:5537 length:1164 start_codon:yes stop_codon:yes gene_type:complete
MLNNNIYSKIIPILGFLLGLFLTLSYLILNNYFVNKNIIKQENFENDGEVDKIDKSENIIENEYQYILPQSSHIYMILTTYEYNNKKLYNEELKWYDDYINIENIAPTDYNKGYYFALNNPINIINDEYVNIANINNVELKGPIGIYFSNNDSKDFNLTAFSILLMTKINNIKKTHTLFEILCNTHAEDSLDSHENTQYIPNVISMNLTNISNEYKIDVTIGSQKYNLDNIDQHNIIDTDPILIGLIFDGNKVKIILNKQIYTFDYDNDKKLSLGSNQFILNKNGELDINLYSFVYYKIALNDIELDNYRKFNKYYINGIYKINNERLLIQERLVDKNKSNLLNSKNMENLNTSLDKCINSKNRTKYIYATKKDLNKIDEIIPFYPS